MARPAVLDALAYPRFRRVWAAGFVSQLGDWMQIVGRAILAYRLTGEAEAVGIVYFATYAPQMIFSLYGGVLADRFDRRRLLVGTQVAQALGAALLGFLVSTGTATLANVAALSFFLGIGFMLAIPAMQALQPAVVPRPVLTSAISLGTATNSLSRVLGPLVAAVVIAVAGLQWVFWTNAISFAAVIAAWVATPVAPQPTIGEARNVEAMRAALRFVRTTPSVCVPIVATGFLMAVGVVYQPLGVVYATDVLADGSTALGNDYFGWLQAAIGAGAAAGILGLAGVGRRRPAGTFTATALAFSVALALLGLVTSIGPAVAVIGAVGAFHFANMSLGLTLVQHEVAEVMRGRVMSIHMTALIGFIPVTALAGGFVADAVGIRGTFAGAGIICLVFSLVLVRSARHLRLREGPPDEEETAGTRAAVGTLLEDEA